MEHKRYIYLGGNIDLPEFGFQKGSVYFGDKIEKLKGEIGNQYYFLGP